MIDIYASSALDGISTEEERLHQLLNQYRADNGLPPIPLSRALTQVANRHVLDLGENIQTLTHGWRAAPYDASDPSTYPSMWTAPQRFNTGYPGNGYENAYAITPGFDATAEQALEGWQNSPGHNAVMLNQGIWADLTWNAVGIGIYENYAVLWFGEETDPTGTPPRENLSGTTTAPVDPITQDPAIADPSTDPSVTPVRRIYDQLTGSHVYTTNPDEINQLIGDTSRYRDEGNTFDSAGPNGVTRFLNTVTNAYFYTISEAERLNTQQTPGFVEVPNGGFNASTTAGGGLLPVYRFYNTVTGRHFFTPNATEAQTVRTTLPGYRDEGIGFFADPLG